MSVDVEVVLLLVESCFLKGEFDALRLGCSVRSRCGLVVGIAGVAVTDHLTENLCSTGLGVLIFLKHKGG